MKKSLSTILLSAAIIFPTVITQANVPEKDHYRYFTLEYSFDKNFELGNYWVLGEQIDRAHSNYGQYPTPKDWKEFAEIIIKRFL